MAREIRIAQQYIFTFFFTFIACIGFGQTSTNTATIKGTITDAKGNAIEGVSIHLSTVGSPRISNSQGYFTFASLTAGTYTLSTSHVGYEPHTQEIKLSTSQQLEITITLVATTTTLDDVTIIGKTKTQQVREQAIRAVVVDTRAVADQPATLAELMNRSSGVRVRQMGGLGSNADISLSGFQGKSIRYFKDGIPMDYLGESFSISSLPINMLERIEIYKGVLPTHLGADALGGAVDLVTRAQTANYTSLGYEFASFNTHRVNLNTYHNNRSNTAYLGVDAYYNHSDNDYIARVMVTDPDTRNQTENRLPLFHNAFTSRFVQVFGGLTNQRWTDELKVELSYFDMDREIQHPTLMNESYGAMTAGQHTFIPSIRYKKTLGKFKFDQFFVYNNVVNHRTDSLRNGGYDWYGTFIPKTNTIGESRAQSLSRLNTRIFTSRSNLTYSLAELHQLEANVVYTSSDREGQDPLGPRLNGTDIDVLTLPSAYSKLAGSIGLKSAFLDRKLEHQFIAKYYRYDANGFETYNGRGVELSDNKSTSGSYYGIADALKYQLNDRSILRLSAEYAYRLPDFDELFGNGVFIVQNFQLKPEKSMNVNLGYRFERAQRFNIEANTFYRITNDMLLLVPIISPYARYENQQNVKGFGVELDGSVRLLNSLLLSANASWHEIRLYKLSGTDAWKNNSRLRNTPYMFGNTGLTYTMNGIFNPSSTLKIYGFYNYIKEFYLEPISRDVEAKGLFGTASINSLLVIPTQHFLSAGASYILPRISFGFEIKNILDKDLYDNFRVQRAGRSLHLRVNYNLL